MTFWANYQFRDEVTKVLPSPLAALAGLSLLKPDCRRACRWEPALAGCPFRYHVFALPLPERTLISRIRRAAGHAPETGLARGGRTHPPAGKHTVVTGIGDDCSALRFPANHEVLVTTDFSLEGVHFRRQWHPPESVGHRCLTRGLSDIAAMGGEPLAAFLSLALPAKLPQKWVDSFLHGFLKLANQSGVVLAGGDTSQSPGGVLADVVVVGSVPKGKAIQRSGARPGDRIYVTGALGAAAATLDLLYTGQRKKLQAHLFPSHFFPQPRINVGRILREKTIASAMIDISDGLSTDLSHICEESGVGAEVWAQAVPRAALGPRGELVDLHFALHGGDDYELLFTAAEGVRVPTKIAGNRITAIGRIMHQKALVLMHTDHSPSRLEPLGWQHFRQHSS